MHLTNYSLNKKAEGFKHSDAADGGDDGSKRTVSSVFAALKASGQVEDVDALWEEIGRLVGRSPPYCSRYSRRLGLTSHASKSLVSMSYSTIAQGRLIEINDHPSLRIDLSWDEPGQYSMSGLNSIPSPVDETIKVPMMDRRAAHCW